MKELAEAINIKHLSANDNGADDGGLEDAAKKWAADSCGTFQGLLLHKALGISAAIIDFVHELQTGAQQYREAERKAGGG